MNSSPVYYTNSTLYESLYKTEELTLQPSVIRPPIKGAYNKQEEYNQAVQNGINYAIENSMQYIGYY